MVAPQPPNPRIVQIRRLALAALAGCGLVLACLNPRPDDFPSSQDVGPADEATVEVSPPSAPTCDENPLLAICQGNDSEGSPVDLNGDSADPGDDLVQEPPDSAEPDPADAGAPDARAPDAGAPDAQPRF